MNRPAATESASPSVGSVQSAAPPERMMKVTMIPSVREIRVLRSVGHDAPKEGLALRQGAPATLHVTATGTGNLKAEAWLEGPAGAVGRTAMTYDPNADRYAGDIRLDAGQVADGDYDVKAVLEADGKEVTDVVTAVDPVRLSQEGLPVALKAEVEAYRASFETDTATLGSEDQRAAEELIAKLQPYAQFLRTIRVVGHCDTRGSEVHNMSLGSNRAASLAKLLGEHLPGVAVGIESAGSTNPEPPGDTQEDWARNRWARLQIESR